MLQCSSKSRLTDEHVFALTGQDVMLIVKSPFIVENN